MRFKELRKGKGVTQKEVANAINCSESTYAKYERGEREANYSTLRDLSQYYGVSIDYILCNDLMR